MTFDSISHAEHHVRQHGKATKLPRGRWRVTVEANGRKFRTYDDTEAKAVAAAAVSLFQVFPTRF